MKTRVAFALLLFAALGAPAFAQETPRGDLELPYVYTQWKHFTVKDGLPNDHIFAVKVDGPRVWVGTEDGLALIDKLSGEVVEAWTEADGLPWRAVTAIEVDPNTGDVWLGLFGGGLSRLSGGRFDHWHQLNSGLVNDVVYGLAIEGDNVWAATTAGASRYNTRTKEWAIFTEKNAPMEEIWNYGAHYADGKVHLAVWGSGVLEFDVETERWREYLDPDGEMEIDLYRDDGINHVIVTGVDYVDGVLWVSTYFGGSRYDGRHWRGYAEQEGGLPSDFINFIKGRSSAEALYCTDKGLGIIVDGPGDTWVVYTRDPETGRGRARVTKGGEEVEVVDMPMALSHSFTITADADEHDIWIGTGKGLSWGIGGGYYPGLRARPLYAYGSPAGDHGPGARAAGALQGPSRGDARAVIPSRAVRTCDEESTVAVPGISMTVTAESSGEGYVAALGMTSDVAGSARQIPSRPSTQATRNVSTGGLHAPLRGPLARPEPRRLSPRGPCPACPVKPVPNSK